MDYKTLSEIATNFRYGKMPDKSKITDCGDYPVWSGYRYVGYYDEKNIEKENLTDSIVRVQLQLDENTSINENELSKLAYGNGAQYTLKVQKMFNQKKREVETPINNSMSIFSSVETYFANTKRSDERIRIAKTIIGEVDNVSEAD